MKKDIISIVKKEYQKLTSKNLSNNYICNYILPIIDYIINTNDKKFIISGSQGVGKSTLSKLIKKVIERTSLQQVMLLSIDDYYLSKKSRYQLSNQVHPLLLTRGVPGTHDIKKLKEHIKQFNKKQFPILTPTFNKLKDDISKKTKKLDSLPRQNHGDFWMNINGGFEGYLSNVRYYSYAISFDEIDANVRKGPSSDSCIDTNEIPPYFDDDWWHS